jgi:cyclohexadieny/prephenate dehydrogenase
MGLIGSSLARVARERGLAGRISAIDASEKVVARVRELGIADLATTDAAEGVRDADLAILCVPVGVTAEVMAKVGPALKPGAMLSDVGSVKGAVVRTAAPHLPPGVAFVPAHPVAGTEHSGPDAGFATLFDNRWCILTPPEGTDPRAIALLRAFWEGAGSKVEEMTPEHHDLVLAVTSHVPHLIAYNIVGTADDLEAVTKSEVIKFSAGGFRDFTRIAASDPTMWRDVFMNNREAVLEVLGRFQEDLFSLQRAIRWGEGDKLHQLFSRTRDIRRGIIQIGQETAEPDFGRNRPEKTPEKP